MYYQIFKNILFYRDLRQSDVAGLAGVSRAAVTKWRHQGQEQGWINMETKTVLRLATHLAIPPELLLQKREDMSPYRSRFLWDFLYPNMEAFAKALAEKRYPAMARLIQVVGFSLGRQIVGKTCLTQFDHYKKYIKPIRRKQLEVLWPLYAFPR